MRFAPFFFIFLMVVSVVSGPADACSVFVLDDGPRHYYGSNYDWHAGIGYLMVNQRGLVKTSWALPDDPGRPLRWKAAYGSVTFVQYGRGIPKGGINEAGLVIEGLLMMDTQYPPPDERPYIGSTSLFKQYLLDTCANVEDVVERLRHIRVAAYPWVPGVHFLVADATGDCAVIAFVDGRRLVFRGRNLPIKALINEFYEKSMHRLQGRPTMDALGIGGSGDRIRTIHRRLKQYRTGTAAPATVTYAMETLNQVSAGAYTQWRVVYDQDARRAYWRTGPDTPLRWLDLKKIDFACGGPVMALPVQRTSAGEANALLKPFTARDNRNLARQTLGESRSMLGIPETLWPTIWQWPDHHMCTAE